MKLRHAEKIIRRVHTEGRRNQWYGTPLSKSWRKLASKMHKAQAVFNHHSLHKPGKVGATFIKYAALFLPSNKHKKSTRHCIHQPCKGVTVVAQGEPFATENGVTLGK